MVPSLAEGLPAAARPSTSGRLHVENGLLANGSGNIVQLRGVSTHGLTWYPGFVDEGLFRQISEEWDSNLVRLAMYSALYCGGEREENLALMRKGIEAAIAADMYVLVDWHILEDADPNINAEGASEFFDLIASEYADCPNLLFEICNEPNGPASWGDVLEYCDKIIPVITSHIPDAVIAVGTPEFDRNLGGALLRPLDYENAMYVLHFYASSHHDALMGELSAAVDAGLPVFISECGISEADGDGRIDFESAAKWFAYLNDHKISYAVWSLSDKDESSAFFRPGFDPRSGICDDDMTVSGLWVRDAIRGMDPAGIPAPTPVVEKDKSAVLMSWIRNSVGERGLNVTASWTGLAGIAAGILITCVLAGLYYRHSRKGLRNTYDDIISAEKKKVRLLSVAVLLLSVWFTLVYLGWRIAYSVPTEDGAAAVAGNLLLLCVEVLGFAESLVLYRNLFGLRDHPLPEIPADAWPDVDIFIATYNEPADLLRRTVNGCLHMQYPDPSKVHIWICDDNRRAEMRALAKEMGVGYFDRPDNEGAKAGNLNHALSLTNAPYIVTLDADMIPRSCFLLKTIPYFVDAERREAHRPEAERLHLGLLQTPQSFYDPDVFQHALYSEKRAPNEQDFFYRTIEPARTSTNSVIYGGSNTILSRKALEDIGGFYTGSITEDFATGVLIESKGYVSLALPEPLASGRTPHTFREHIQQRTRWARGVIVTARKLGLLRRKGLSAEQRISYWSSVVYWYSPVKNLIYMLSPLLFSAFAIPVFRCSWAELLVYWLPMFFLQDLALRYNSRNTISAKWSGIYETSVMPHLLIPVLKESLGISLSAFKVTDKAQRGKARVRDWRAMLPFLVLTALSLIGSVRVIILFRATKALGLLVLLFWIVRNLYFLVMALFLVDGRDSDGEAVRVRDAESISLKSGDREYEGITTQMTEHSMTVFLDGGEGPGIGASAEITVLGGDTPVALGGLVTAISESRKGLARTYTVEILDRKGNDLEYLQLLYDRVPTLPQSYYRDLGILPHLWQNIAHRVARTRK
ncbi:MAG: cellulase family glycosylhydrolase [Clostridia bacterium]|nr:cellulase family glycosylhydrolase [Clostridia bacterium]